MKKRYAIPIATIVLFAGILGGCGSDDNFDPNVQLQQDIEAIDQYLSDNNITAAEDESGLRFVINDVGLGKPIEEATILYVTFDAQTLDGTMFAEEENLPVNPEAIPLLAWEIGFPFISEGGSMTLYSPSGLAFGRQSGDNLPANSNVIFEVSLYDSEASIAADGLVIDAFLQANNIQAEVDPASDIRYIIHEQGDGPSPSPQNSIAIDYEGRFLDGEVFDSGEGAIFQLGGLIPGWQMGLPLIGEGGSITLYIPSFHAYGPNGIPPQIPEEAIMVFDISLLTVF